MDLKYTADIIGAVYCLYNRRVLQFYIDELQLLQATILILTSKAIFNYKKFGIIHKMKHNFKTEVMLLLFIL